MKLAQILDRSALSALSLSAAFKLVTCFLFAAAPVSVYGTSLFWRQQEVHSGEWARVRINAADEIELAAASASKEARVELRPAAGLWDWSARAAVVVSVRNPSDSPVVFYAGVSNPEAQSLMDNTRNGVVLMPGQTKELRLRLMRRPQDPTYAPFKDYYMYFRNINVRDNTVDPARIAALALWLDHPTQGQRVVVSGVRLEGEATKGEVPFFPFVDEFGQYRHSDWPGKIHPGQSWADTIAEERQEMSDWPGPRSWNQYGGWKEGPRLKATGFFRVEKYDGKWWLVDPEGCLFWSHGPTGVGFGGDLSPFTGRENWFEALPAKDGPLGRFFGRGRGATYMYYEKRAWEGFDFASANAWRKYGDEGRARAVELLHDRLRSWGFNTLGNWSSPEVYRLRRTPYTVALHLGGPSLHYRLKDVYAPAWRDSLRRSLEAQRGATAGDPWNLGYFVDNELWWGWRARAAEVGLVALAAEPGAHSKRVFIEQLQRKHGDIATLNAAWGTEHASWEALREARRAPDIAREAVQADCGDFGMAFAEYYFSAVREEVKRVAPDNLYLGVRFHGHIDAALVALCAKYADVVSYNIYDIPPTGRLNQYNAVDRPILVGEWGIRANPLQTPFRGERPLSPDPAERSESYARYLEAGFRHPLLVGAHFFQFRDQPISGRPDGEAIPRGLVNLTDTPHFDLVQTNRRLAYRLYERRAGRE